MEEKEVEQFDNNINIGKVNIIIADDEVKTCEQIESMLKKYSYINIMGIANTDEEEIKLIEELKPDVVVTDLMRNHEFTGLDIIKDYSEKEKSVVMPRKTMYEYLKCGAEKMSEKVALVYYGRKFTYEELMKEIDKYASSFISYGIKEGDVGICFK